ncbi:P-loop containing nucleoside triphosphate hydrolase protein [Lineolata rhizophorae]|uniref:P-loop containing nucleoside triphosphate hydrolase protein n=1 Tax=Lineolata rhizophorae TaxID=578093 RepID=A0A6A6P1U0_9PEZI|nr:P-loop containing nucleoside triphosphate hydrolase protein [Lineolata rhizophorae]
MSVLKWAAYEHLIIRGAYDVSRNFLSKYISEHIGTAVTKHAIRHVMTLSNDFFQENNPGYITMSVRSGSMLSGSFQDLFFNVPTTTFNLGLNYIYFCWKFDVYFVAISAATCVAFAWVHYSTGRISDEVRRDAINMQRSQSNQQYDVFEHWRTVASFNKIPETTENLLEPLDRSRDSTIRRGVVESLMDAIRRSVNGVGLAVACVLMVGHIAHGRHPVGDLPSLMQLWGSFTGGIAMLCGLGEKLRTIAWQTETLSALLQRKPAVVDREDAIELPDVIQGRVEFRNVHFGHDPRKPLLKDVSFVAEPNKTIAIVGRSGGGKSTLVDLTVRFFDVTQGSILVDGNDISGVKLSSLRKHIGLISQNETIFATTIMKNVRYGKPDASDEDVYQACRDADIHDKIMSFPDGYQTKVERRGSKLSGGEVQRLVLARVILKDPKIIILDEATSQLDALTESNVLENAINTRNKNRTKIIVAHRLRTIEDDALVLVVENGEIIEKGINKKLRVLPGSEYKKMWDAASGRRQTGKAPDATSPSPHGLDEFQARLLIERRLQYPSESVEDSIKAVNERTDHEDGPRFGAGFLGFFRLALGKDAGPEKILKREMGSVIGGGKQLQEPREGLSRASSISID